MRKPLLISLLLVTSACLYSPTNGTSFSTNADEPFIIGLFNQPNQPMTVQLLRDPNGAQVWSNNNLPNDPNDPLWVTALQTTTGTQPFYYSQTDQNNSDPQFIFSGYVDPTLFPGVWKPGGVMRLRAFGNETNGTVFGLQIYDEDETTCFNANPNASWRNLGSLCGSPYQSFNSSSNYVANLLATTPLPSGSNPNDPALYLQIKGAPAQADAQASTQTYYNNIQLPNTLAGFQQAYGMAQIAPGNRQPGISQGEITTVYFNANDLGIGREMHCIKSTRQATLNQIACYVSNFGDFSGNQNGGYSAWTNSILAASVAMVYNPNLASDANDVVKFIVYDSAGNQKLYQPLDNSLHPNGAIPQNCLTCHGGTAAFDDLNGVVKNGARFLPFDLHAVGFYSQQPSLSRANQEDLFRQQNQLVSQAAATATTQDLFTAWYGGKLNVPGTQQSDNAVPPAWNGSKATAKLYTEVVRTYCRACHQTVHGPNNAYSTLDWHQSSDFLTAASNVLEKVCKGRSNGITRPRIMPQAKITQDLLFSGVGRAHLIAALTDPEGALQGFFGRTASCDANLQ